jgi:hypothetical protein
MMHKLCRVLRLSRFLTTQISRLVKSGVSQSHIQTVILDHSRILMIVLQNKLVRIK